MWKNLPDTNRGYSQMKSFEISKDEVPLYIVP